MPIISEPVTAPATVPHAAYIVKKITNKVNPGQMTVINCDQAVYCIGKQLQWMFPDEFNDVFWFMGPLHIEQTFLKTIGNWLEGSGWTKIYDFSKINLVGRADSFLTCAGVAGIKRSRYAHQVTLASLMTLASEAFALQTDFEDFDCWKESLIKESPTANFWFTVIEMEILLFVFIRSLRESDFQTFITCLRQMMTWFAALDHVHYFRWMSVFLKDLDNLPTSLLNEFVRGNFTVNKTVRVFSGMGIDQAHEQNNKCVKIDGGAIGILDNERALLEWSLTGPLLAEMLDTPSGTDTKHHEDTPTYEENFRRNRLALIGAFGEFANPFQFSGSELINIVSKEILSAEASKSVMKAKLIGEEQTISFARERLEHNETGSKSFYSTVSKNSLMLYRSKQIIKSSKLNLFATAMKERVQLHSTLYVACKSRQADLADFFCHENHDYPPALSDYGNLRKPTAKSDVLKCLINPSDEANEAPLADAYVIDGAAFVHMNLTKLTW